MHPSASSESPPFSPFISMDSAPSWDKMAQHPLCGLASPFPNNLVVAYIDMHLDTTFLTQMQGLILLYSLFITAVLFPFNCLSP